MGKKSGYLFVVMELLASSLKVENYNKIAYLMCVGIKWKILD